MLCSGTVPPNGGGAPSAGGVIARSLRGGSGATGSSPIVWDSFEDVSSPTVSVLREDAASRASGAFGGVVEVVVWVADPVATKPATTSAETVIGADIRIRPHQSSTSREATVPDIRAGSLWTT